MHPTSHLPSAPRRPWVRAALALAVVASVAACGGAAEPEQPPADAVSQQTTEDATANTAYVPVATIEAKSVALATAESVVAGGAAGVTITCLGGGTASYTVTGPNPASFGNGQLDAGEVYTVSYSACRRAAGWAEVTGVQSLTVDAASANTLQTSTSTSGLVVRFPLRTLTLNGTSTQSRVTTVAGATTTTTSRWITPTFTVVSQVGARTSTFAYSAVDLSHTVTSVGGSVTGSTATGTLTLTATLPGGSFAVTQATVGVVEYDAAGNPVRGTWRLTLPRNVIEVEVVPGTVTVRVDWGADGTWNRTYTFTVSALAAAAG